MCVLWIDLDVGDVDHRASEDRPPTSEGPGGAHRECAAHPLDAFGGEIVLGGKMNQFAVEPKQRGEKPVAQPHGAPHNDVEDRLDVGRRARDHPQDVGRGGLLLERRRQLSVSRLQLLEQPDVLDRDHRLVGERLEDRDLFGREGMDLGPPIDEDGAQRRALAQQRSPQKCPGQRAGLPHAGHALRELRLGRHDVLDVDRPSVAHNLSAYGAATDREGVSDRH